MWFLLHVKLASWMCLGLRAFPDMPGFWQPDEAVKPPAGLIVEILADVLHGLALINAKFHHMTGDPGQGHDLHQMPSPVDAFAFELTIYDPGIAESADGKISAIGDQPIDLCWQYSVSMRSRCHRSPWGVPANSWKQGVPSV